MFYHIPPITSTSGVSYGIPQNESAVAPWCANFGVATIWTLKALGVYQFCQIIAPASEHCEHSRRVMPGRATGIREGARNHPILKDNRRLTDQPGEATHEQRAEVQTPTELGDWSQVVARLQKLPSYHPTVVSLLSISTETESAIDQFEAVFQADPGFATELLQAANSVELGLRGTVDSIHHALVFLGTDRISSLAFSLAMQFYINRYPSMRDVEGIWAHSIATAVLTEAVAEACNVSKAGIYTAGLVHDIGRLGLLMTEGQRYAAFSAQEFPNIGDYVLKESALVGAIHTEAGSVMAAHWGFPQHLEEIIRHHHDPFESLPGEAGAVVRYACRLATAMGYSAVRYRVETPEELIAGLVSKERPGSRLEVSQLRKTIDAALKGVSAITNRE